jgi:hypothetical protein
MKSWVSGVVFLYIGLLFLSLIAEHSLSFGVTQMNIFDELIKPPITDFSNPVQAVTSFATDVGHYAKLIIQVIFLWFPDLWVGNWIWFYYVVCFPITAGMVFGIIQMLRGNVIA